MTRGWNRISGPRPVALVMVAGALWSWNCQASEGRADPFGGFSFAAKDASGRNIEVRYENGEVTAKTDGGTLEPIVPGLGKVVPPGSTAEMINGILREHRIVFFSPGAEHEIEKPLEIPSDTFVDFRGASLKLKDNANAYLIRNENQEEGNTRIILRGGRLLGNGGKQTRHYSGDYRTGYFGFGTAFTKVDQLLMQDFNIENTNAWGVAYFLCGTVRFLDFTFDQSVARGKNGDGITGIARRVYVDGVRGYTNDDVIAVSTGKGTVQGNDIGIADDDNIDVQEVVIRNVRAETKDGQRSHVGIGLYPTAGRRIGKVSIDGLEGEFDHCAYRLQNYWPAVGDGFFGTVRITGVKAHSNHLYASVVDVAGMEELVLDRHEALGSESGARLLTLTHSRIEALTIQNSSVKGSGAGTGSLIAAPEDKPSEIRSLRLDGISMGTAAESDTP